jgi:hypothetical protein
VGLMSTYNLTRFAQIDFRNDNRVFGIKAEDRFSHIYIIGKTGTGKSTLLETMAVQDMESGNGFALIDPHGDLVERIAQRIPISRRADVIYLNAADPAQPYGYNPLRHVSEHRIALAASGMMEVFKKMVAGAQLTSNCSYFAWPCSPSSPHGATYMKPIVACYRVSTQKQAR